jgi:hypothetical protein
MVVGENRPTTSGPTTATPGNMPENQTTTNSPAGLKTFYVYVHVNNQEGGTKTAKEFTASWFFPEQCIDKAVVRGFALTPRLFQGSESWTPIKVSVDASNCLPKLNNSPTYVIKIDVTGSTRRIKS